MGGGKIKIFSKFYVGPKTAPKGPFGVGIGPIGPTNPKKSETGFKKTNFHNGIGMLVEQAAECFRLWFDKKPNVEEVKGLLDERI